MADMKHPDDIRANDEDPPCLICGQPKAGHPDAPDFHSYQRATPTPPDPKPPQP